MGLRKWSTSLATGTKKPLVATCERLCAPRAKDVASADATETAGHVRPVWAEADEDVLRGYLQREKGVTRQLGRQS